MKDVIISVSGGVVEVLTVPEGVRVLVKEYDNYYQNPDNTEEPDEDNIESWADIYEG